MSKQNKVNPDHYKLAGRLTPDDLARERMRQGQHPAGGRRSRQRAMPPWMLAENARSGTSRAQETSGESGGAASAPAEEPESGSDAEEEAGVPRRRAAKARGATASRKRKRPAPRARAAGKRPAAAARKAAKASSASGTSRARKTPRTRSSEAGRSSPRRGKKTDARRGPAKRSGATRKTQKKAKTR